MSKRINALQEYTNKAFGAIQRLSIQSTETNVTAVSEALNALHIIYNTLGAMAQESPDTPAEEENQDGDSAETVDG